MRDGAQDDGLADQGLPQPIVLCELEQGRERYVATGSDGWAPSPPPLLGLVYLFLSGTPLSGCALCCTSSGRLVGCCSQLRVPTRTPLSLAPPPRLDQTHAGALNILKIWEAWVSGELRPAYLCRPEDDGTGNY